MINPKDQQQQQPEQQQHKKLDLSNILLVKPNKKIIWMYQVYPDDSNFNQRDDRKNNYMDHDDLQSQVIEYEYQTATKQGLQTHSFLISGNFQKYRNNHEYAIVFENMQDPSSWYKTNTQNFRVRRIKRLETTIANNKKQQHIKQEKL